MFRPPLRYHVIAAALRGEADAVIKVLRYYSRYMDRLATRKHFDVEARCRLESKLLNALLYFKI